MNARCKAHVAIDNSSNIMLLQYVYHNCEVIIHTRTHTHRHTDTDTHTCTHAHVHTLKLI